MRDPWLFWGSLAVFPFAGIFFLLAMRVGSDRLRITFEIATQVIGGIAAILFGYEAAFRTTARDIMEFKAVTSVGYVFLLFGALALAEAVAKALGK